jgi:squalene cyclase
MRVAAITLVLAASCGAAAQPDPGREARSAQNAALSDEITPALDASVARGLEYLAQSQDEDGSWDGGRFGKNVAITALACLAFMADGHLPGRGRYGDAVDRGLDFVLENATESGLIAADGAHGPMYGHGFATLFLGEVYGMTAGSADSARSARVHEALVRAVRLIERTQNDEGGWRYNPVPYDADVSVTICQVMALRSARNAGLETDKAVIDRAVEYTRRCQNPDGGFRYQADGGSSAWPRSAAGVATLFYAGIYEDNTINAGLEYLRRSAMPGEVRGSRAHYAYGQYYSVQAMYLAGGEHWAQWWPAVRAELLSEQMDDGSWDDRTAGSNYGTAMMLIVLQMPKRYLPIFQK